MTQICHMLRTRGSMASLEPGKEITEVCPWDSMAIDCGQDAGAAQVAKPRVFKSHESRAHVAAGAKYIYVARNPLDAFVSFWKFLPPYMGLKHGDVDEEAFAAAIFAGASHSGQIWDHFLGWWEARNDPNVLWVCFEDLKQDLRGQVARVARFMELPDVDDELLDLVSSRASFDFMSSPEASHHFDDHFVRAKLGDKMGATAGTFVEWGRHPIGDFASPFSNGTRRRPLASQEFQP
jgi:aryl sulfotransferase